MGDLLGVSVDELLRQLRERHARLPHEIGAFVALEVAESLLAGPAVARPEDVRITNEGSVSVFVPPNSASNEEAARSVVALLTKLLVAAGQGVPPVLLALAERGPSDGKWDLRRLRDELEASLVPMNRAAARRVLARLLREGRKETTSTPPPDAIARDPELDAALDSLISASERPPAPGAPPPPAPPRPLELPPQPGFEEIATAKWDAAADEEKTPHADLPPASRAAAALAPTEPKVIVTPPIAIEPEPPAPEPDPAPRRRRWSQEEMRAPGDDVRGAPPSAKPGDEAAPAPKPAPPPRGPDTDAEHRARAAGGREPSRGRRWSQEQELGRPRRSSQMDSSSGGTRVRRPSHMDPSTRSRRVSRSELLDDHIAKPRGSRGFLWLLFFLLLTAGLIGTVAALRPDAINRLLGRGGPPVDPTAEERARQRAEEQRRIAEEHANRFGDLRVSVTPDDAQVLLYVGRGPATVANLPTGVAYEFVAVSDDRAPGRAVIPKDAQWQDTDDGPLFELAIQAGDEAEDRELDLGASRMPRDVGSPGDVLGRVRVITTPPGAKVYQLIGFAPDVQVADLRTDQPHELIVYAPGHEPERVVVGPSDFHTGEGRRTAEMRVELRPLPSRRR